MIPPNYNDVDTVYDIVRRYEKFQPVTAAFWAKETERSDWNLYICSEGLAQVGARTGYGRMGELTRDDPTLFDATMQVMLLDSHDPMAVAAQKIERATRARPRQPIRFSGGLLGSTDVEGAWIYPLPHLVTA